MFPSKLLAFLYPVKTVGNFLSKNLKDTSQMNSLSKIITSSLAAHFIELFACYPSARDLRQHPIKDTYVLGSHKYKVMKWKKKLVFQLQDKVAGILEQ